MDVSHYSTSENSRIPVEAPDNIEMGGKIDFIKLCVAPIWKTILRYFLYLCTAFIMYLINLWVPSLRIGLSFSEIGLSKATTVIVYGAGNNYKQLVISTLKDKNIEVVPLVRERTSTKNLKVIFIVQRIFKKDNRSLRTDFSSTFLTKPRTHLSHVNLK